MELLLSHLCRCHQERTGRGFSCGLGASPWSTVADRVGSFAGTPQPASPGVHCWFAGLDFHCLSSTLRAGTEPRRVYLGLLEAARVAECLPQGLLATERNRATNSTSHAPPSATDHRLLEAIFFMARIALYYARVSRCQFLCRISTAGSQSIRLSALTSTSAGNCRTTDGFSSLPQLHSESHLESKSL